jgi:hypothetical protein
MDRLSEFLEKVLPASPDEALGGRDLITRLRQAGFDELSDDSLRTMFSTLVKKGTSVIARRDGQHGYYKRTDIKASEPAGMTDEDRPQVAQPGSRNDQLEEKFRAIYMAWCRREGTFPVHIEHTRGRRQTAGLNAWKFPDVVSVEWDVLDEDARGRLVLDRPILEVRKSLGEQPFKLSSIELKFGITSSTLRSFFFQCVSNSRWAHVSRFAIASDVTDEAVANELRRLGASYGISVVTFSLSEQDLDKLPAANSISDADDVEEKLGRPLSVNVLVNTPDRDFLDWEHIKDMQDQHEDFNSIFGWISRCIADCKPYQYEDWKEQYG